MDERAYEKPRGCGAFLFPVNVASLSCELSCNEVHETLREQDHDETNDDEENRLLGLVLLGFFTLRDDETNTGDYDEDHGDECHEGEDLLDDVDDFLADITHTTDSRCGTEELSPGWRGDHEGHRSSGHTEAERLKGSVHRKEAGN